MDAGAWIAIAASVLIVGGALLYIVKAKKNGRKCIGCPDSASCRARHCCACQAKKNADSDAP